MKLHELKPSAGSRKKAVRRGRGDGSGKGGTCGRGENGQKSRTGAKNRPYFEGGQIPLFRRIPKRGFNNPNHKVYNVVNISLLDKVFEKNEAVDVNVLQKKGIVGNLAYGLKILGNGEISKPLTVKANRFSASARSKIEAAGGTCETV